MKWGLKLYSESISPLALFSDVDAKFLHGTFVVMNDGMMNLFMILRPGWAGMRLLAPAHGLGDEWRPVIGQWPGSRDLIGSHSSGPAPAPMAFTTRDGHWAATTGRSGAERSDNTGHYQMSVRSIMRRSVRMSAPSSGQRTPAATLWMSVSVRDTGHQAHTILCCLPSVIKIICFQSWLFIQFVKVSNTYVLSWKKTMKDQKNKFNPFIFKCQESSSR